MAEYTPRTYKQLCAARGTDLTKMADEFALIKAGIKEGLKVALIDGAAAGDHTVTGIKLGAQLVTVLHIISKASIATMAEQTSEYTVTADNTINNAAGTSSASNQLLVMYVN